MTNSSEVCVNCGYNKFSHDVLEGLNHKFKPQTSQKTNSHPEGNLVRVENPASAEVLGTNITSGSDTQTPPTLKDWRKK
jgi:hypothetical protein